MPYGQTFAGQPVDGFIYVMECEGYYKIGWSHMPRTRRHCVQVGSPFPIRLVGVTEGSQMVEEEWHYAFRDKRVRGEWFSLTEEDIGHILNDNYGVDRLPDEDDSDYIPDDDEVA